MPKFDFRKRLGSGNFGEVWLVVDTALGTERAIKLIPVTKVPDKNNFFREAQILKVAEHSNIVHVYETGMLDENRVYVAMEYLRRGSLEDEARGGHVPLSRVKRIMIDVLRGLEYAHAQNIIHRDVKPGNILIGNANEGKLSDFGLAIAASFRPVSTKDYYAYVVHMAPELFKKRQYSVASDIYACGVTLYRLVNGDNYLPVLSFDEIEAKATRGLFPDRTQYREFIPRNLKVIINKAMNPVLSKRFANVQEMRHALEQLPIQMNWQEQVFSDGNRWIGSWDGRCFEVERIKTGKNQWCLSVKKGKSKQTLRRLSQFCITNGTRQKVVRCTQRLLQDVVLGRVK